LILKFGGLRTVAVGFKEYEDAFLERGFSLRRFPDYLRLVKDHCEVHVSLPLPAAGIESGAGDARAVTLRIPVLREGPDEKFGERLLAYLEDRNASPKGPGRFVVSQDCIWCECEVVFPAETGQDHAPQPFHEQGCPAHLASIAHDLVAQVEKLGPKILNMR
jgi:hypothetical protein